MVFSLGKIYPSISKKEIFNFKDLMKLKLQPTRIFKWLLIGLTLSPRLPHVCVFLDYFFCHSLSLLELQTKFIKFYTKF